MSEQEPANRRVNLVFMLQAVDAETYGRTAVWPPGVSVTAVARALAAARGAALGQHVVPAIVDERTWNAFQLSQGATFHLTPALTPGAVPLTYVAIGQAPSIPRTPVADGGVLVDFQSLAANAAANPTAALTVTPNTVWVRSGADDASVRTTRAALSGGDLALDTVIDRRALVPILQHGPLSLAMSGVGLAGASMPLLLALAGALFASWVEFSRRRETFGVLRALGMTRRQITGMLLWEQSLLYLAAVASGAALGLLAAYTLVPGLVVTSLPSADANTVSTSGFFLLQNVPSVRIVLPVTALWMCASVLAVDVVALLVMALLRSRAALGETLRFSED
jgi:hypothetical protein